MKIYFKAWKSSIGGHRFYHIIETLLRVKTGGINMTRKQAYTDSQAHIGDLRLLLYTKAPSFLMLCSLLLSEAHLENTLAIASLAQCIEHWLGD